MLCNSLKLFVLSVLFFSLESYSASTYKSAELNRFQSISITAPVFSGANAGLTVSCKDVNSDPNLTIRFRVTPIGNLQASNVFTLEMFDVNFPSNIIYPEIVSITQNVDVFTMVFKAPTVAYSDSYKLKVRSSAPSAFSISQNAFAAYYLVHNREILLNTAIGISSAVICSDPPGSSTTLSIYNSGTNSSPLFYPYLKYVWKKRVGTTDTVITNGVSPDGTSLTVTQPGFYFVETYYGACSGSFSGSLSRVIEVTIGGSNSVQISAEFGQTEVCENPGVNLALNVNNSSYTIQWFLNGSPLPSANTSTYHATQGGDYTASVDNGSCSITSAAYTLNGTSFNANLNTTSPYELAIGDSFDAIVSTDANTPSYKWFLNDVLLSETSNILNISSIGNYSVIVTENQDCISSIELLLSVIGPDVDQIPNLISPNGDGINDTFKVPFEFISTNNLNLEIYNSSGKQIFVTDNYQNTWPEDTNEVFQSNAFFYFKLSKENQTIKEGILTVIK